MSVYSFSRPLQAAVYATLSADAALMAQVTGVYDLVPPEAVTPYLILTVQGGTPFRTKTRADERLNLTLTVVSAEAGFREAQEIAAAVSRALNEGTLTLTGARLALWQPQTVRADFDEAGRKVTVRLGWQAIVQEVV